MRRMLLLLVIAASCKGKDTSGGPSPSPSASPAASPSPTPSPSPSAMPDGGSAGSGSATIALTCDAVLPTALRDKYFAGATITATEHGDFVRCEITLPKARKTSVSVMCRDEMANNAKFEIDDAKKLTNTKELPGVGKAAVVTKDTLGNLLVAFDDDSNCRLGGVLPPAIDASAFAKDVFALLPLRAP